MKNNMAGAFINSIDLDDHQNRCERDYVNTYNDYRHSKLSNVNLHIPKRTGRKPFFANVLNEAIFVALDEIDQEEEYYRNV